VILLAADGDLVRTSDPADIHALAVADRRRVEIIPV